MFLDPKIYENITKPKEVPSLSLQQIFDTVVRRLVAQGMPCYRMYEPRTPEDLPVSEMSGSSLWCYVNFNSQGHKGPLTILLEREDLRYLQRAIPYEKLQDLPGFLIKYVEEYREGGPSYSEPDSKYVVEVVDRLAHRGVKGQQSLTLLGELCDAHEYWANYAADYRDCIAEGISDSHRQNLLQSILECMSHKFIPVARRFNLDSAVLNVTLP